MKKSKLLHAFALSAIAAVALVGCDQTPEPGPGPEPTPESQHLTVWAPIEHQDLYEQFFKEFKASDEKYANVEFEFGACGEGDAYGNISKDVTGAADVFTFANDQLYNLINVGALARLGGDYLTFVETENNTAAVEACKGTDGGIYAYPMTLDNGYMLTYDASVVTNYDENTTFFDIAQQCAAAGKKFAVPMGDSWYGYGFFSGFGAEYSVEYNDEGKESNITCNYNGTEGYRAGSFLINLANTEGIQYVDGGASGDQSVVLNQYLSAHMSEIGAFISYPSAVKTYVTDTGAWDAANIRCDVLPMMEADDGTTARMRTFLGMKMVGVNKTSDNLVLAHDFAEFITSKDAQLARYEALSYGPSNIEAAKDPTVASDVALVGLNKQFEVAADPQINVPSTFWTALQNFGAAVGYTKDITLDNLQAQLDGVVEDITTIA